MSLLVNINMLSTEFKFKLNILNLNVKLNFNNMYKIINKYATNNAL